MKAVNFAHPTKTRFVVIRENILGYIHPREPMSAGILTSSLVNGATHHWTDGPVALPVDGKGVRFATPADFEAFDISPAPYLRDTAFNDFPATVLAPAS